MAAIDDLRDLGYTVTEIGGGTYRVVGYGIESTFTETELAGLADPAAHTERAFQFNSPEAADVRRELILTEHTVVRPDPLVDVFDVAGPLVNGTGMDAAGLASQAPVLDAYVVTVTGNEQTLDERLEEQLPLLRASIDAITANPPLLFASLSNQERVFLRRLARNQADLIKLRLRDLESTD